MWVLTPSSQNMTFENSVTAGGISQEEAILELSELLIQYDWCPFKRMAT